MDHIELTLQLGPVPYLHLSFTIFKTIWAAVGEAEDSKEQLKVLAGSVAHLLYALDKQYREGKLNDDATLEALIDLESLLKEISAFIQKQGSNGFFRSLIQKEDRLSSIDAYHRRIATSINAFQGVIHTQLAALMDIHRWQAKNDEARMIDQKRLHAHLHELEANQRLLIDALSVVQNSPMAMMATLRRRLEERRGDQEELRFMIHSLRYLMTMSGQQVDIKPWTITSFDVEFGPLIGAGGLWVSFFQVINYTDVALKAMNGMEGITPRAAAIRHEIDTWSRLRHPNIIQFLGANILDDKPFLVMPLIEHGNARDFIDNNPDCNRLKIIHQASLGLTYLHSQKVIHGDLKAVNVLIDEGERAMLCDFGLARIKADVNSRVTTTENNLLLGSQNWMAPELFEGRLLRFPCDIYSFAMTAYEIFTHEIPFGNVSPAHLSKLVVKRNARPDRPSSDEAPQMTNAIWDIIEQSWSKNPADRPTASRWLTNNS
ncbi:kinase-like domain-containing protein [Flammula alnicola]|nr:kinase-like domain-containing protein [Flammula alnicola]